jgi:hypothetical protein
VSHNLIFLKDLEDFNQYRLDFFKQKIEEIKKDKAETEKNYKTTFAFRFLHKILGLKPFKEYVYSVRDELPYQLYTYEKKVEFIEEIRLKLVYNRKVMTVLNYQDIDKQLVENPHGEKFYHWAKENNRPY